MGGYQVRVGGKWLAKYGEVSGLTDTGVWRQGAPCGLLTASCTFAPPQGRRFATSWLHSGATFEIFETGKRTRYGLCNEPAVNDDGTWTVSASGLGVQLSRFPAWAVVTGAPASTLNVAASDDPNAVVDYAHTTLGMVAQRGTNDLTGGATPTVQQVITVLGAPTGGTFSVTYRASTTSSIAYNAAASTVQSTLRTLTGNSTLTVAGSAGGPWTVTFPDSTRSVAALRVRNSSLTGGTSPSAIVTAPTVDNNLMVGDVLANWAARAAKHLLVDDTGYLSMVADPTIPKWLCAPEVAYLGSFDENYATHLAACFIDSDVDPAAPAWVSASGTAAGASTLGALMATQNGTVWKIVDLTPRGPITAAEAQADLNNRFTLVGARMGWTGAVPLNRWNLWKKGAGAASPLSVREGEMIQIPDIIDARSSPTTTASVKLIIGELTRDHDSETAVAIPTGFPDRDYQGALNAAASKADTDSDAVLRMKTRRAS